VKHPFLSQLGIQPTAQARGPRPTEIPSGLNGHNGLEWSEAVNNTVRPKGSTLRWWARVINAYIKLCRERDVFAFANDGEGRNSYLEDLMIRARQDFVRFCQKVKFFDGIKIRSTERQATAGPNGVTIKVWANSTVDDPLFVNWLRNLPVPYQWSRQQKRFNYYEHRLSPVLTLWVEFTNHTAIDTYKIGYDVNLPGFPSIPNNPLPSRKEVEEFVLEVLWLPLLRANRPFSMDHRLI
jgi:hypothetical protein